MYLIDLTGVGVPGHWVNPARLHDYLEDYADVEVVDSWEEFDELVRNPPDRAVVVNAHGELVPMPDGWESWEKYFMKIGANIRDRRWIWVGVKGYPFYYYYSPSSGKVTVGPSGVNKVLSVVGATADFWSANDGVYTTQLTELGEAVSEMLELDLAEQADTPRACRRIVGTAPALVFYSATVNDKTYYGSAAYKLGKGFLVINGFSPGYDEDQTAKAAVLATIYTYIHSVRPPRKVFNRPPHVYIPSLEGTHSHWINKEEVAEAVSWLASLYTPHVHLVSTYGELSQLFTEPPSDCIVVNAHGEAVPIPNDYVGDTGRNWRVWSDAGAVEVFLAGANEKYVLYASADPSSYPDGIKLVYEHLVLSASRLAVGVLTGPDPTEGGYRLLHVETRQTASGPVLVAVTPLEERRLCYADYLEWYRVELVVEPGQGEAQGKVAVYRGASKVAEVTLQLGKHYSSLSHVALAV